MRSSNSFRLRRRYSPSSVGSMIRYQATSFGVTRNNKCEQSGTLLQYVEFLYRVVTPASNYAILVPPLNELVHLYHLDPEVLGLLKECTKDIEGASVENNKFCVSVHYCNVAEMSWDIVGQRLYDVLKDYPCL
ncbi:hypothetical protein RJT34_01223 [Clitoria ternatea]|uniref:Uncharacterized protein n=1 Tax=Clitoria ternatea TaxID=43366 RepID=A0AAN9KJ76_CLITE